MIETGSKRRMRVLAMVPAPMNTTPGQRFRIEQWEPYLHRYGIDIEFSSFSDKNLADALQLGGRLVFKIVNVFKSWLGRLHVAVHANGFDLAYIFRESSLIGPAIVERILVSRGIPFVFDFDDAVWIRYTSSSNPVFSRLRCSGKTSTSCRLARHVIAGNAYLREYASQRNEQTTIVPTSIDTNRYQPRAVESRRIPTVGWTGSHSTERHLEVIRKALERLRNQIEYRLVIEVQDLSDFDVGIMPLPDSPWERGKCGLKALQCMALAIPVVVSPVGVNAEIVSDGINGFLAETCEDWVAMLFRLLIDPSHRGDLGRRARRTVENSYSAEVCASRVAEVFRAALV
jgi:glycosyltransferase involved in cell wall biosynthesis